MVALHSVCLVIISFYMITTFLKTQKPAKYFLTIHGKAVTRFSAKDIKDRSIPTYNHTIPQQKNMFGIQIGLERILVQRLIRMVTSILFLMKEMINTIFTRLITPRKLHSLIFLLLLRIQL